MIRNDHKRMLVILCAALLLTAAVGGTVAYLTTQTGTVVNTFTPSSLSCDVEESFDGSVKTNVTVKNTGDVNAYIRAVVIATWQDIDGNVYGGGKPVADTDYTISFGSSWTQSGDYYYCNSNVKPQESTPVLITKCEPVEDKAPDGYALNVQIIAQAVQAEGMGSSVTNALSAFAHAASGN